MGLTRRQLLSGAAAGASSAVAQFRAGNGPKVRTTPAVCLYSQLLIKVPYDELGPVLRGLGVDGCDLSVFPGGHVNPELSSVDMMRSVEAVTGAGLDVPVITTTYTSLADPTIRNVVGICGEMGVPLFKVGHWKYTAGTEVEARLAEVQRDLAGLAALARAVNMAIAIQNLAGENVGEAVWDINMMIRGMDPRTVGYDFDVASATVEGGLGGWSVALRLALPRLKMVTARDFVWSKDASGAWKVVPCPLGEGMVDWPKFFAVLARARFAGPISIQMDYQPKDELAAMRRDVDFVRKQVNTAYGGGAGGRQG
ncbi:MAG: sugar phosphate isomerase/epimerase [Acidobacteriia bacterium]|nr:sugar phosphate isomerase/epimerase [Terriglobia bacterium]